MKNSACCPLAVCCVTHEAILFAAANPSVGGLAGAGAVRGCAEALPSANRTTMIAAKQSRTPSKTRSLKNPPSLTSLRARLRRVEKLRRAGADWDADVFFIV